MDEILMSLHANSTTVGYVALNTAAELVRVLVETGAIPPEAAAKVLEKVAATTRRDVEGSAAADVGEKFAAWLDECAATYRAPSTSPVTSNLN